MFAAARTARRSSEVLLQLETHACAEHGVVRARLEERLRVPEVAEQREAQGEVVAVRAAVRHERVGSLERREGLVLMSRRTSDAPEVSMAGHVQRRDRDCL